MKVCTSCPSNSPKLPQGLTEAKQRGKEKPPLTKDLTDTHHLKSLLDRTHPSSAKQEFPRTHRLTAGPWRSLHCKTVLQDSFQNIISTHSLCPSNTGKTQAAYKRSAETCSERDSLLTPLALSALHTHSPLLRGHAAPRSVFSLIPMCSPGGAAFANLL